MKKRGNVIYNLLDDNSGENVTLSKVTKYADGSAMSDDKVDGVIYFKREGEYFKRNYSGPLNVKWFGAVGDGASDDTFAFQKALAYISTHSAYERNFALYVPEGFYKITQTLNINLSHSGIHIFSHGVATLSVDVPDGDYCIEVDYITGATANFPNFSMSNLIIADIINPNRLTKKGIKTSRLIGAYFQSVHFNYLAFATDLTQDSNLNKFDTCQWRGNYHAVGCSQIGANNNLFLNCQWRYNTGTSLDTSLFNATILQGGDFEPYNACPVIIANTLIAKDVRLERNDQGAQIRVLNSNDLNIVFHADGATQPNPAYEIHGTNNRMHWEGGGCYMMADFLPGSKDNYLYVGLYTKIENGLMIKDRGKNNVVANQGSFQTAFKLLEFLPPESLVSPDLTTWTAFNCTVVKIDDYFEITATGPDAYLEKQIIGDYNGICVGLTAFALNNSGQCGLTIGGQPVGNLGSMAGQTEFIREYGSTTNYHDLGVLNDPMFVISIFAIGGVCQMKDLRVAANKLPY